MDGAVAASGEQEHAESKVGQGAAQEAASEASQVKDLPEWAQRELKAARDEAAKYRVANKELTERIGKLKTPEEVDEIVAESRRSEDAVRAELDAQRARWTVRDEFPMIPADMFEFVQGGTVEEMRESAKKIAAHFEKAPASAPLPRMGGGVEPAAAEFNVLEAVRKIPR